MSLSLASLHLARIISGRVSHAHVIELSSGKMTSFQSRNGYSRLPIADPDVAEGSVEARGYGPHRDWDRVATQGRKKGTVKPGLFHMFGDRWKYAANHMSVAIASQSESEHEAERVELMEIRPKRPKLRRGRIKSSGKSPKTSEGKQKFRFNIIEEPILPGDTVQRVALRYSCPVSDDTPHPHCFFVCWGIIPNKALHFVYRFQKLEE